MKKYWIVCLMVLTFGMMGQSCDGSGDQKNPAFQSDSFNGYSVTPVPEPSSALIWSALALVAAYIRMRKS